MARYSEIAEIPAPAARPEADDLSTAGTATENTPLLQSDVGSSRTLTPRDDSPASAARAEVAALGAAPNASEPQIGWRRAVCIIVSMWALIFLQGEP
jgi:hypothetical protein